MRVYGKITGWDSETHLIKPGMMAPRLACVSWDDGKDRFVVNRVDGLKLMRHAIRQANSLVVAHNAGYDLGVLAAEEPSMLPSIFDGFRAGRIVDTITRQMLLDVALGMRKFRRARGAVTKAKYALSDLVSLYFDEQLEKVDTWRLRYALLDGVPIKEWPADAYDYALNDATWARKVYGAQESEIAEHFGELPNQVEQQRAAWALHLMSMWGIRADAEAVDRFFANCEEQIRQMHSDLEGTGIFKEKKGGTKSRVMKEIRRRVVESLTRQGIQVPYTDPSKRFPEGQVQTDKDALQLTDDPALHVLAESMVYSTHLKQWGPTLRAAVHRPACARYNVLVETGRTSCSGSAGQDGTNFQNPPRKGDVRPAIVPRRGWVFGFCDADTVELRAHAQNCLELVGWSKMAEALIDQRQNKGPDLHVRLAAELVNVMAVELEARRKAGDPDAIAARQFAKIPNFGFPGGLGAETFVAYAAAQLSKEQHRKWFGLTRDEQIRRAAGYRDAWFAAWPENRDYFRVVGDMIDRDKRYGMIRQLQSGRIRGEVRFTAAANGFFQGRVADAMKECLWRIAEECYVGCWTNKDLSASSKRSPLYGSRPVMFLHDETAIEHPEDGMEHDRAMRQQEITTESLSNWMPDVPCSSSVVLARRWYKSAEAVIVDGKLVPSKPKRVEVDGKIKVQWVHDAGG